MFGPPSLVAVTCSVIATMNVMLLGPNARIEVMSADPTETCLRLVRRLATPGAE